MTSNSDWIDELLFCDSSCGVNASDAMGYQVPCTCGNERIRHTILSKLQEVDRQARIEEIKKLENHHLYAMHAGNSVDYSNLLYDYYTERLKALSHGAKAPTNRNPIENGE